MSPSISIKDDTKAKFDEMKPDDVTHDEYVVELLKAKQRDDGQIVDPAAIVDEITRQTAAEVELASYRGVRAAIEDLH